MSKFYYGVGTFSCAHIKLQKREIAVQMNARSYELYASCSSMHHDLVQNVLNKRAFHITNLKIRDFGMETVQCSL